MITGWRITAFTAALLMVGSILWLALGQRDPQTVKFVEYVASLPKEQVIRYTAQAHAFSTLCNLEFNSLTDQVVYKAAGIRRSKLAKDPTIHAVFADAHKSALALADTQPRKTLCNNAVNLFGEQGSALPGMLGPKG